MSLCFHISINAARNNHTGWGDTNYASALMRALRQQGHRATLFFRGEHPALTGQNDIVLRIVGPHLEDPIEGVPNILWVISPPNLATKGKLNRFQAIFTCSVHMTQLLCNAGVPATYLPQATDITHFRPDRFDATRQRYGLTFVGSHAARAPRHIIRAALDAGFDVNIWGPGWDKIVPKQNLHGTYLDYEELADVYAQSDIVLNSHMPHMAAQGMMSNRSFDALASGAVVVSDYVRGFDDSAIPGLTMVQDLATLPDVLRACMTKQAADPVQRQNRHDFVAARFGFDIAAAPIIDQANALLRSGAQATSSFVQHPEHKPRDLVLRDPIQSDHPERTAVIESATEVLRVLKALEYPNGLRVTPPPRDPHDPSPTTIHTMMAAHRTANALALDLTTPDLPTTARRLAQQARRVVDLNQAEKTPLSLANGSAFGPLEIAREMREEPLYAHSPTDYDRDALKPHLRLWNRGQPVSMPRPIGVFIHLYYAELAEELAQYLTHIDAPMALYVSTDTQAKADHLAKILPQADIRVTDNRGRDIFPKFYGFGDVYERHDVVLHLHGKKSQHSGKLDSWLDHILRCLLPSKGQVNRILSLFQTIPELGVVAPVTHQPVLSAAHWGANYELAQELAYRMGQKPDLPRNDMLRFPVGSMFWARVDALRPLLDLGLQAGHFPPENGQLDGTVAHAIERMIGVTTIANGYVLMPVAGADSKLYRGHQQEFKTNKDLRDALRAGLFTP